MLERHANRARRERASTAKWKALDTGRQRKKGTRWCTDYGPIDGHVGRAEINGCTSEGLDDLPVINVATLLTPRFVLPSYLFLRNSVTLH